jgi:hypothetical protein
MDNFDLKQYLAENKLNEAESTVNAPYNVIQRRLKQLAGYHPADIKNNLDKLGAEEFKKQLDDLKSYVDQYFTEKPINSLSESYQSNIGMYEEEFKKRGFKRTNEEYSGGGYEDLWYKDFPLGRFCVSIVTFDLASGLQSPKHQQFTYNIFFDPYPKFETKLFGLLKTKKHQFGKMIDIEEGVIDFGEGLFKVEDKDFIPGFFAKVDQAEKIASKITDVEYLSHEDSKSWKRMAFPDVNE